MQISSIHLRKPTCRLNMIYNFALNRDRLPLRSSMFWATYYKLRQDRLAQRKSATLSV